MKNAGKIEQNTCNTGMAHRRCEQNYRILVVIRKIIEEKPKIYGDIL
jgi:hypothetical protein